MTPPQGSRLDSWKEIAEYLGRNVRTVTRWAVERGLPIHHVPGGKRGHVFAFKNEIDAWLLNQNANRPTASARSSVPNQNLPSDFAPAALASKQTVIATHVEVASEQSTHNPRLRFSLVSLRWRIALVAAILLAAAVGVSLALRPQSAHATELFAIKYDVDTLIATNPEGHTLWTHRYPDSTFMTYLAVRPLGSPYMRIADFFRDGNREAAAIVPLHKGPNPEQHNSCELDFFSSRGDLLWKYSPVRTFQFGTHELSGPWFFQDLFVSQSDSRTTLWATAGHHIWGDAFISQIDPRNGQATLRFVNTGVLYRINELQTSSATFLLAGGFNNEWDGGSLAIINENRPFAASPQTPGTRHHCDSCPPGVPDYYFVFPRSEINRLAGVYEDPILDIAMVNEGIQVRKFERLGKGGENIIYAFSKQPPFKLLSILYDSDYDMLHKKWSAEGKISHSLANCPERLHPLPIRLWTPAAGWTEIHPTPATASE
jgi:hypothetical protein